MKNNIFLSSEVRFFWDFSSTQATLVSQISPHGTSFSLSGGNVSENHVLNGSLSLIKLALVHTWLLRVLFLVLFQLCFIGQRQHIKSQSCNFKQLPLKYFFYVTSGISILAMYPDLSIFPFLWIACLDVCHYFYRFFKWTIMIYNII